MAESDLVENLEEENTQLNDKSKKEEQKTYKEIFSKIIEDFSDFLSKRSVYEAAPENSKVLVFNSDLSFKEMIKAFINEDIYCALIYDSKKEFFIGIITISDILFLFEYIIEKAQEKKITDYNKFIKEIFTINKTILTSEEEKEDNNENKKEKNFDILKYLTKINYNDYYEVIKKNKKIHILYSISLDSSLLDVLKIIYKVGVHRLVVEETKKKGINDINKKKENEIQNNIFDTKTEKEEKTEKSFKDKSDIEKSDKEKSEKKLKKVKTKKKASESEEGKENKEGEKPVKKKVKKIKKKKTENELDEKDKDKDNKEKEDNENKEGEKTVKKKVKKIIKKKKTENESNENDNKDNNKEKETKEKKEEDKKSEEKKENTENSQKSGKSIIELEDNSNKEIKLTTEDTSKTLELPSETQNYTGFVTYETVFDFLIYNYYSMEMKEFDLSLEDLKKMPINSSFIKPLSNFALISEEVHLSFSKNISSKNDILPILTNDKNDIFGFLYLRDYLYFVSNCESNQNLTNEQFLINMYEGIEEGKPYGKERIIFLEYNDETKKIKIKNLLERINGAPEKKIVLVNKEEGNKLEFISLKNIFDVIVEMNNSFN